MRAITALASGIAGAEHGTAEILTLNGGANANWYASYVGGAATTGATPLDSHGGAAIYVNQSVLVRAKDSSGVVVREWADMEAAPGVEVISQSFTGRNYDSSISGRTRPTTLQQVLDAVLTSFGTYDWYVDVDGVRKTVKSLAVLYSVFFVVTDPTYGATGDGTTNDRPAIQAAIDAASAAGGGIVYFPAGTYLITSTLNVPADVWLLGAGQGSAIRVDHATNSAVTFTGLRGRMESLLVASKGGVAHTGTLVNQSLASSTVELFRCGIGSTDTAGTLVGQADVLAVLHAHRCLFLMGTGAVAASRVVSGNMTSGRVMLEACDIVFSTATFNTGGTHALVQAATVDVHGCYFNVEAVTPSATEIKLIRSVANGALSVTGCVFTGCVSGAGTMYAIAYSTGASATGSVSAAGNVFGANVVAYEYATSAATGAKQPHAFQPYGGQQSVTVPDTTPGGTTDLDTDNYQYFYVMLPSSLIDTAVVLQLAEPRFPGQKATVLVKCLVVAGGISVEIESDGAGTYVVATTVTPLVADILDLDQYYGAQFEVMWDDDNNQLTWVAVGRGYGKATAS